MTKRMLIDAAHAEETRVVVLDGQRIEELDFESSSRKQLRGNIYLAKVTRVEPSLQAAFVEYGGNRHGFLSFTEVHPDYYQIPVADREALMREEADDEDEPPHPHEGEGEEASASTDDDDLMEEELERRRRRLMRRYKIQEVVRRRQIMLVQVVKEERGNKGAALTTYLSLAGRYCVLMPNTARGGGISRKITNTADRKRLKTVAQGLDVPHGMGVIIRTAGAARTKMEIRRDYEYLLRMWENIRETTLQSIAPALIYAEEDLVKRAIRDMFDKDLDSIEVEGEAGYREARDFMRMIMPLQAKKIQHYRDPTPLFVRHKIEDQLAQIHSPVVPLRSGGYIVINQTEALVAVDVNSGRATRERNIEATALKTNMEAAEETARQLRLRDLAGLIVIDFIDMDEGKNNRAVEKVLKDCLKDDRARIQMGKISPFGLMEISRQRRRSGVLEGTTHVCEHCQGTGRVRSVESSALSALRSIEVEAAKGGAGAITVRLPSDVALYVLNEKRVYLARLEHARDLTVTIAIDMALSHADVEIDRTESRETSPDRMYAPPPLAPELEPEIDDYEPEEEEDEDEEIVVEDASEDDDAPISSGRDIEAGGEIDQDGDGSKRRRRRRRGRRDERSDSAYSDDAPLNDASFDDAPLYNGGLDGDDIQVRNNADGDVEIAGEDGDTDAGRSRRRRRGRRGGRRMREETGPQDATADPYAWVHAHGGEDTPRESEDPYAWRDPHTTSIAPQPRAENRPPPVMRQPRPAADLAPRAESRSLENNTPDPYAWSDTGSDAGAEAAGDTPPVEPRSERGRRPRNRRGRGGAGRREQADAMSAVEAPGPTEDAPTEPFTTQTEGYDATMAAADVEPISAEPLSAELVVDTATAAAVDDAEAPETESMAAVEDVIAPPPAAPAPLPEPDPAEISAPPEAPKRGWWRRRG